MSYAAAYIDYYNSCRLFPLKHVNKKSKHRQSLYSIEFGPSIDTIRSRTDTILGFEDDQMNDRDGSELSPKPMTPRRVKRRSVMARGTNSRQSGTSRRSHKHGSSAAGGHTNTYSHNSMRHSRRKYQQNPVTKILDQQQDQLQKQQKYYAARDGNTFGKQLPPLPPQPEEPQHQFGSFQQTDTVALTTTNLQMLNQDILPAAHATNNILATSSLTKSNNNHYHSFRKNIPPDPIYYNINGQASLLQQNWPALQQSPIVSDESPNSPTTPTLKGHFNPTYQHSTTNLNDAETNDEMYNNRPPSVRSSYSNFHGTRPLSTAYISSTSVTENVFAGLPGTIPHQHHHDKQQKQYTAPSTPPLYATNHQHVPLPTASYPTSPPQAIPFTKRTASRESIRSMAFLNSGPPAYNLNYHTPPDSETTM